jgi:amino acid adenylation domain-containing protein
MFCLGTAHALVAGSIFSEHAQVELFRTGEFISPAVIAPTGNGVRTEDGCACASGPNGLFADDIAPTPPRSLGEAKQPARHHTVSVADDMLSVAEMASVHRLVRSSPFRDALWFTQQLMPDSPAGNICRCFRITGQLDVVALRSAWRTVLRHNESMLTIRTESDGWPRAGVSDRDYDDLSVVDVGAVPVRDRRRRVAKLCADQAALPFDLTSGAPVRLTLVRLTATEHVLLLVVHRVAADERSALVLLGQLSDQYTVPHRLPEAPHAVPAEVTDDDLAWWRDTLTPLPGRLGLPTDFDRPTGHAVPAGVVLHFDWGADLANAVAELGAATGTNPIGVLFAAYLVLLARYAGEDRICVGVPASVLPAVGTAVGPWENLLAIPADSPAGQTFRELLVASYAHAVKALRRRHVPFADVVAALGGVRDPRRNPLCDNLFRYEDEAVSFGLTGVLVEPEFVHHGGADADLALHVTGMRPSVAGRLVYRSDLFESETAGTILGQLHTLLAAAVAEPDRVVAELPLDPPERTAAAVRAADRTGLADDFAHTVPELVARWADTDAAALHADGDTVSYRELHRRGRSIGAGLRRLGVGPGVPVAVRMPSGTAQLTVLLGVLASGGQLLWLGTGDVGERGRAVLSDLRPAYLIVTGDQLTDDLSQWYRDHGQVVDASMLAHDGTHPAIDPATTAYVAYTSGSTGRPKGIPQTHGALAQFVDWMGGEFGFGPGARVAQWVAPEHDPAIAEVFATLVSGGTLCPVPPRVRINPEKFVEWLAAERITALQTVPSFARELLKVITARPPAAPAVVLDRLLLMGEALPGDLVNGLRAALPGATLVNLYGPTETIAATWHEITTHVTGPVPIGRTIPGRQVLVLDDEDRPCPTGVTGNIVIRSRAVTTGYLGGVRSDAFRPVHGMTAYRTGDLARTRPDGSLVFAGRKDFQVKVAGNRVELTDVEAALAGHESVLECAVVPLTDQAGLVTHLVAHVVPQPGSDGGPAIWRAQLRRRFGNAVLPPLFRVAGERLPRTVGGKVDRRRLPAVTSTAEGRAPASATEVWLAALWAELLGVPPAHVDENFFAAGGHSLLLLRLASRIRTRFRVDVLLWEIYAGPTVASLSAHIDAMRTPTEAVI